MSKPKEVPEAPKVQYSFIQQFIVLFWKNLIIKYKHPVATTIEFVTPLCVSIFLAWHVKDYLEKDVLSNFDEIEPGDNVPYTIYEDIDFSFDDIRNWKVAVTLCYKPENNDTMKFIGQLEDNFAQINSRTFINSFGFQDDVKITEFINLRDTLWRYLYGCIIFKDISGLNDIYGVLKYAIRSPNYNLEIWKDHITSELEKDRMPDRFNLPLQYLMYKTYADHRAQMFDDRFMEIYDVIMNRIPYPAYRYAARIWKHDTLALLTCFGFLIAFCLLCHRVCREKESQSREMLRVCGLGDNVYWFSTVMFNLNFFFVIAFLFTASYKIAYYEGSPAMPGSTSFWLLVLLTFYSLQIILFGCIFSILFNNPTICSTVATIVFILTCVLYSFLLKIFPEVLAMIFIPNIGLVLALRTIQKFESYGEGLSWSTLSKQPDTFEDLTFLTIYSSLLASCLLYGLSVWYLDKVWPWQPGVPKPFYFLFSSDYWNPTAKSSTEYPKPSKPINTKYFEEIRSDRPVAIECSNLSKSFTEVLPVWQKLAVDHIDLKVCQGEITCLLGHNGAGKTTTINMITGMFTPTGGSISINGFDLVTKTHEARSKMTLCPQHNPLYDELTVTQHLWLYGSIKGFPRNELQKEIDEVLVLTEMTANSHKLPSELSGGMKRKLCLGIALVGGSQIIILDEPSSGLDTEARRVMWDTLKRIRRSRTILMTTHDMEEADVLGDRIVIMHSGSIVCSGSSLFLKTALGAGYILTVSKASNFKSDAALELIRRFLPKAIIKNDMGREINYELKEDRETKQYLADFFENFEGAKSSLGVASFGISASSMEEVFLKVGQLFESQLDPSEGTFTEKRRQGKKSTIKVTSLRIGGWSLLLTQFYSLFIKKLLHAIRSWKPIALQISFPCIILSLVLNNTFVERKSVDNSLSIYPDTKLYIQSDEHVNSEQFIMYLADVVKNTGHEIEMIPASYKGVDGMLQFFYEQMEGRSPREFLDLHVVGLSIVSNATGRIYNGWTNPDAIHATPILMDLILATHLLESTEGTGPNPPLKTNGEQGASTKDVQLVEVLIILSIPISLTFVPAFYVLFPVEERQCKAKLIQIMTGLHPMMLHFSAYAFDLILHFISSIPLVITLSVYGTGSTSRFLTLIAMFILLMAFGVATIPLSYLWSFVFRNSSKAYNILVVFNSLTGVVLGLTVFYLNIFLRFHHTLRAWTFNQILTASRFLPMFSVSWAFKKLFRNIYARERCAMMDKNEIDSYCTRVRELDVMEMDIYTTACCPSDVCYDQSTGTDNCIYDNPIGWNDGQIIRDTMYLFISAIMFWSILYFIERGRSIIHFVSTRFQAMMNCCSYAQPQPKLKDPDVVSERGYAKSLIDAHTTEDEALVAFDLYKTFGSFVAVCGLSFTVHKKECFGLLGVNGAGKSTTFSILTRDIENDDGDLYQGNLRLSSSERSFLKNLGYCPQTNPLIDKMTGREMLNLYAGLRGVPDEDKEKMIEKMIDLVDFDQHADKLTSQLSGGNKRKLSIAIAMMGSPKILLLDEPTTGVDPHARHKIWSTLSYIRQTFNCSMILTTHSMHESESLCARMGIMVKGEFACLGSSYHLKKKFGQGYTITMKVKPKFTANIDYMAAVKRRVQEIFDSCILLDEHEAFLVYQVLPESGTLSQLFRSMEMLTNELNLEDFSLNDTTLEQVFISLAKKYK